MTTTPVFSTDKAKVTAAFKALRKRGFLARQNYLCCASCASSGLASQVDAMLAEGKTAPVNAVFYHRQDNEVFGNDGNLQGTIYLKHGIEVEGYISNPESTGVIVEELRRAGLSAEWTGEMSRCIEVKSNG